jgi:hypothetical protein
MVYIYVYTWFPDISCGFSIINQGSDDCAGFHTRNMRCCLWCVIYLFVCLFIYFYLFICLHITIKDVVVSVNVHLMNGETPLSRHIRSYNIINHKCILLAFPWRGHPSGARIHVVSMRWSSVIVALGSIATATSVTAAPLPELPRSNSTLNLLHGVHSARFGPFFGYLWFLDGVVPSSLDVASEHGDKLWLWA